MRNAIVMLVLLGMAKIGMGQEPIPATPEYLPRPAMALINDMVPPQQPPTPIFASAAQPIPASLAPAESRNMKIEHLTKAADHLDAAGLHDEARKTRDRAEQEKAAVAGEIKRLQAAIERMQAEIERLRAVTQQPQVVLKLRVVELSSTKLQKLGFNLSRFVSNNLNPLAAATVEQNASARATTTPIDRKIMPAVSSVLTPNDLSLFLNALGALSQDRLVRILAEPNLVTMSNRPAHFESGGEISVPIPDSNGAAKREFRKYGTTVDFLPVVLPDQRIRVECMVSLSELDYAKCDKVAGETVPGFQTQKVSTRVDLRSGQTLVISGPIQRRTIEEQAKPLSSVEPAERPGTPNEAKETQKDVQLVVLITPEIIEPMRSVAAPAPMSQ
jgi:Flp pilus assembly secretin CpaC